MKKLEITLLCIIALVLFSTCNKTKMAELERELELKDDKIELLEEQLGHLQKTNASLLDRMSDLSIINKTGAESIQKSICTQEMHVPAGTSQKATRKPLDARSNMEQRRSQPSNQQSNQSNQQSIQPSNQRRIMSRFTNLLCRPG